MHVKQMIIEKMGDKQHTISLTTVFLEGKVVIVKSHADKYGCYSYVLLRSVLYLTPCRTLSPFCVSHGTDRLTSL